MDDAKTLEDLTQFFRRLGVKKPEDWARSQLKGNPEVIRCEFLRQAWKEVVGEHVGDWIKNAIALADADPNADFAETGMALKALRARGVTDTEILAIVRGAQSELLFYLCRLLDGPGYDTEREFKDGDYSWGLFQVDECGKPMKPITGLHRSLLEIESTRPIAPPG